jgi:diguanylate cyclase (GGDEF)-like protein
MGTSGVRRIGAWRPAPVPRGPVEVQPSSRSADPFSVSTLPPRVPSSRDPILRPLVRLASLVTTTREPTELIEAVAETAREILAADSLSISEVDEERKVLRTLINVGRLGPGEQRWPLDETYRIDDFPDSLGFLVGRPVRRLTTVVDDPEAEPAEVQLLRSLDKRSSLQTSIVVEGRIWGELWAARGESMPVFDDQDGDIAEVIVGLVSAGLAQASAWKVMRRLALTDALTGLENRRGFDDHLERQLTLMHRARLPLALVLGDVNGLKRVNDTHGHASGDDALRHVASMATRVTAGVPDALAARLGGDEFALILPALNQRETLAVASAWCRAAAHSGYHISLACGVAVAPVDGERAHPSDMLRAADSAQYRAKRSASVVPVVA